MRLPFKRGGAKEHLIEQRPLPAFLERELHHAIPDAEWQLVEQALRDWLICCANEHPAQLAVPSRTIAWLWEEFAENESSYRPFCDQVFRRPPDPGEVGPASDWSGMARAVGAWDRSQAAKQRDTILWSLDEHLQIDNPIGISSEALGQLRSEEDRRYGGPLAYGAGGGGGW